MSRPYDNPAIYQAPAVANDERVRRGRVTVRRQGNYMVDTEQGVVSCSVSSALHKQLVYPMAAPTSVHPRVQAVRDIKTTDPVAIGDFVHFIDAGDGTGRIVAVLPRVNRLSRRAAGAKPLEQTIVANVDQLVAVIPAADPKVPKWALLDRYLASAEEAEVPTVICLTKLDLNDSAEVQNRAALYAKIGYQVVLSSVVTGAGIAELREALRGKFSVLLGKSGVGKTSLLNALQPGLGKAVKDINAKSGKGRHTTSHVELHELDFGGALVDTPGVREFGLWNIRSADVAWLFPELRRYVGQCQYASDCSHTHEPGCAVKAAMQKGKIDAARYESYTKLYQEMARMR